MVDEQDIGGWIETDGDVEWDVDGVVERDSDAAPIDPKTLRSCNLLLLNVG